MKKCPNCAGLNLDDAKECMICGASFEVKPEKKVESNPLNNFDNSGLNFNFNNTEIPKQKSNLDNFDFVQAEGLLDKQIKKNKDKSELKGFEVEEYYDNYYIIKKFIDPIETRVVIPSSVVSIDDGAFEDAVITSVTIKDGLKRIGKRAFCNCKFLSKINIPSSVARIGDEAFLNCENLEIEIPDTVEICGNNVLSGTLTEIKMIQRAEAERIRKEEERRLKAEQERREKLRREELARQEQERLEEERRQKLEQERKEELRRQQELERKRKEELARIAEEKRQAELERKRLEEEKRQKKLQEEKEKKERAERAKRELDKAIDLCYEKAVSGDSDAMTQLGDYYFNGNGVTLSYTEAVYWYQQAVNKGNKLAMERLGDCYLNGYGVTKSAKTAEQWYLKSMK